jgi:hypothetical protein
MEMTTGKPVRGGRLKAIFRAIGAVVVGLAAISIPSSLAGALLRAISPNLYPQAGTSASTAGLVLVLIYSVAFSGLGGYVTARLAGSAARKCVIALAVLQLVLGIVALVALQFMFGDIKQVIDILPGWFLIASYILPVPAILLGGTLKSRTS